MFAAFRDSSTSMVPNAVKVRSVLILRRIWAFIRQFLRRRSLARLLSTFLCCIIIVIRPFSRFGGRYAFLVLALKELVFSVQENLAQQLELTVLNIMGALLGIGVSTLAKYLASLFPPDSAASRAICAVFLLLITFFAGLVKSRLARLQLSTRISCFVSIWILTNDIGVRSTVLSDSGNFLWITISAAVICSASLLFVMSILRWSSSSFEKEMVETLAALRQCLSMSLDHISTEKASSVDPSAYRQLCDQLLCRSIGLNETYSQAAFDIRIGRLSLKSIRPFIGIIEHLRRELVWGMSPINSSRSRPSSRFSTIRRNPQSAAAEKFLAATEAPTQNLGNAIMAAMLSVERLIQVTFHSSPYPTNGRATSYTDSEKVCVADAVDSLQAARDEAREQLARIFDEMEIERRRTGSEEHLPEEILDRSLAMIALLQMSQEMRSALQIAQRLATLHENSKPRLWLPRLSLSWLGVPPGPYIFDDHAAQVQATGLTSNAEPSTSELEEGLSVAETRQGLAEKAYSAEVRRLPSGLTHWTFARSPRFETKTPFSWGWFTTLLITLWSHPRVLRLRLKLSDVWRAIQHSRHLRHAAKNTIGVAILSFPAFMSANSEGRRWFTTYHGQWMTISYLWVLETNTGATWRTGYLRMVGTILGAAYAYVTWVIAKTNPYGLVSLVTVADIPITWIITKTSVAPLAVPASVALPPIAFAMYITPDIPESVLKLAILRALMIGGGILAALLMNSLVFPRHCRVLFLRDTSRTLCLLSCLYLMLSHDMFRSHGRSMRDNDKRKALKLALQIRNALYRLSALIETMHDELSLLPKPLAHYRRVVNTLQKLLDLMTGLRKIRENIPRKETVANVFNERREFMSCVCIVLFACQNAFRAREPLPQFLPSARHAFDNLESHVQDCIRRAREEDEHAMGLSLVYAFAEQEVLKNMVDTLEELLEISGRLFGTSTWLSHDTRWSRMSVHEERGHGWYSTFNWDEAQLMRPEMARQYSVV
ncbi:hypothetical protein OBBRIDRAFT_614539 [Obba rivulosa]|uniref:DUF2421 domain-containing protein n=1 Tax=Obba rivulosa TaxID=1052685 RepID=A0A8E2DT73_9APHY|nr:hypothetical protein OBBRIDRAFT_614539 [Obba rivulosa]